MSSLTTCPGSERVGQGDRYLKKALHRMYPGDRGITEILRGELTVLFIISLVRGRWDFSNTCPVMRVWELCVAKLCKSVLVTYCLHPISIRVSNWSSCAPFCPSFSFNSQTHFYLNKMQFSMVMLKMFQFCSTDEWNGIFLDIPKSCLFKITTSAIFEAIHTQDRNSCYLWGHESNAVNTKFTQTKRTPLCLTFDQIFVLSQNALRYLTADRVRALFISDIASGSCT